MGFRLSIGDIAFGAAAAFLCGVFAAALGWGFAATMITAVIAAMTMTLTMTAGAFRKFIVIATVIVPCIVFLGSFYFHFFLDEKAAAFSLPIGKEVSFRAVVVDEPKLSGNFLLLPAQAQRPYFGEATVFADPGDVFHYGDLVQVAGIVDSARQYGEDPAVFPQKLSLVAAHRGFFLREWMIGLKEATFQKFNDVLPADEAALLGGMTLGGTAGMSATLKNQMERSGTSYLAAMYGYKMNVLVLGSVGLLAGFVARRKRFVITLALLALFVAMTGADASAIRAAIMAGIAIMALELGRMPSMRNALALTAAGMALFDPAIVTQAAFLLSFLSLIGIVYLGPPLRRLFRWEDDRHDHDYDMLNWKKAALMAVSSLLPIIPVLMATFGQFSVAAFASNMLVFPAILPMMLAGCAVAAAGFAFPPLAFFVARFAEIPIWYELGVVRLFSVIVVPLPQIFTSAWVFIAYYAALGWFVYHYSCRKNQTPPSSRGAVATKTLGECRAPRGISAVE